MSDCLFCKIAEGKIPSKRVFENETVVAFRDIHPQAPVHILVVPRQHIATLNELNAEDAKLIGEMVLAAKEIAAQENLAESGYRVLMNCNRDGGQSVYHIHLHLLGGRYMKWPPG